MVQLDTRESSETIARLSCALSQSAINSAMARSINRTLTNERKVSRMAVKAKYNIPGDVANNFKVYNANPRMLIGKLGADAKPISLNRFNPTFNSAAYGAKVTRKKNKATGKVESRKKLRKGGSKSVGLGITVTIIKGQSMNIPFAFLGRGGSMPVFAVGTYGGGKGFTHLQNARNPLAALMTTSLYQAVAGQVPRQQMNKNSKAFFDKTFERELNYQVLKAKGQA